LEEANKKLNNIRKNNGLPNLDDSMNGSPYEHGKSEEINDVN